jgi:hypothetical protein
MALKVNAAQLSVEGLFKLLGGSASDRNRFWEILKGITTPFEAQLINQNLNAINVLAKQTAANLKGLQSTAGQINKRLAKGKNIR